MNLNPDDAPKLFLVLTRENPLMAADLLLRHGRDAHDEFFKIALAHLAKTDGDTACRTTN